MDLARSRLFGADQLARNPAEGLGDAATARSREHAGNREKYSRENEVRWREGRGLCRGNWREGRKMRN